jgi:hypothetical protein
VLVLIVLATVIGIAEANGNQSIEVFVYPLASPGATENPQVTAADLASSINKAPTVFDACTKPTPLPTTTPLAVSTPVPEASCAADNAMEFVRGSVDSNNTITLTATIFSATGAQVVGSLVIPSPSPSGSPQPLSGLSAAQRSQLLGEEQLRSVNGVLTINPTTPPGFEQFVQLVPGSLNATDPDYSPLLIKLLNDRGISAQRSAFTLGAIGSNPGGSFCSSRGEEYLAYTVNTTVIPNVFIGTTRMNSSVTADYVTCTGRDVPTEGDARTIIPTTKTSALTYASIFGLIWTKLAWTAVNGVAGAAGGFADLDPNSTIVRSAVGETALRNMVDNLCRRLDYQAATASASTSPVPPPPAPGQVAAAVTNPGNAGGEPFDIGVLPGAQAPYNPRCTKVLTPRVVPSANVPSTGLSLNATVHASGDNATTLIQDFRAGIMHAIPSPSP